MLTEQGAQAFLDHCQARNLRPATITWYSDRLKRFASLYRKLPEKPEPIEKFLADISGAPETKQAHFRTLRAFYNFICHRYDLPNPMRHVTKPRAPSKIMPTLEPVELMLLLNSAENERERAMLMLFIDTGIRANELAKLRWQDIKTDTILVTGKTGQREVPISEETLRMLCRLTDLKHDYVFRGERGPLTRKGIYHIVRRCMKKAGIKGPKLGPHRLRHTFGRMYLMQGGDVRSLQEILGHANITTTEMYLSLTKQNCINKHHKFTPLHVVHAAAQERLFDAGEAIKEAEQIVNRKTE